MDGTRPSSFLVTFLNSSFSIFAVFHKATLIDRLVTCGMCDQFLLIKFSFSFNLSFSPSTKPTVSVMHPVFPDLQFFCSLLCRCVLLQLFVHCHSSSLSFSNFEKEFISISIYIVSAGNCWSERQRQGPEGETEVSLEEFGIGTRQEKPWRHMDGLFDWHDSWWWHRSFMRVRFFYQIYPSERVSPTEHNGALSSRGRN